MPPESQGWSQRALEQLSKRVDALEDGFSRLIGIKPTDAQGADPKLFKVGVGTWIALLATVVVPIVTTILIISGK